MTTDRKQDTILFTALGLAIFAIFALTLLLGPDPVPPTPAPGPVSATTRPTAAPPEDVAAPGS